MGVKSRQITPTIQKVQTPQTGTQEAVFGINHFQTSIKSGKASAEFNSLVIGLEKSDSFLQRLSAINSQIERQLINK